MRDGIAVGAELSDGSFVDADTVIVGLGAAPNVAWLEGSGLSIEDGVLCDEFCRAAPGIYAAGDVAKWYHAAHGAHVRVGHRFTSTEQGAYVGRSLANPDAAVPFTTVPFFWSDQYDLRIQCHGHILPGDDCAIVEGSLAERKLLALFGREGHVSGLVAINLPRRATAMRAAVVARQPERGRLRNARALLPPAERGRLATQIDRDDPLLKAAQFPRHCADVQPDQVLTAHRALELTPSCDGACG